MTIAKAAKKNAKVLIGKPNRPSLHRAGGKGSPRIRLSRRQPIESIYVDISASKESDMMILNANVLPKLMRHSTQHQNEVA